MKQTVPTELSERIRQLLSGGIANLELTSQQWQALRAQSPETSELADRILLEQLAAQHTGLTDARKQVKEFQALLEKVCSPPLHPALFHQAVHARGGLRAIVQTGNLRCVVSLGEDIDVKSLGRGDEVFLNNELNLIVAASPDGGPQAGETALFERCLADGRMLLRWHDDLIVVDAAHRLRGGDCKAGDAVRFDRNTWLAFERIELPASRRYLLETVPILHRDQVGGQEACLKSLLSVLTTILVEPVRAAAYGLTGRNSILMWGPPGCGKTLMARIAISEIKRLTGKECRFAVVKPAEWESPWVGQTQENIRQFFRSLSEAGEDGFAVAFLDEVESVGRIRGGSVSHHSDKFLAALLAEMDGFADRKNVAIICATNRKDLLDAALYERCSDLEINVGRPDLRGGRAIFQIHLPDALPYHPNGALATSTRQELIDLAVSKFYSPNAGNELCTLRFRDGKQRTVVARELASGRLFENVCRTARRSAFLREVRGGPSGVQLSDMEEAVSQTFDRMRTILTTHNAHHYLADLPQDVDVVSVEPIVNRVKQPHRYLSRAV